MVFCLRKSCVALLNTHKGKMKALSSAHNFKTWDMRKFSFHFSDTLWLAQKLSHHDIYSPSRSNPKIRGISVTFFYGRLNWTFLNVQLRVLDIFPLFTCIDPNFTENQSIKLFTLYFRMFSCCCVTYPIDFISLSEVLHC